VLEVDFQLPLVLMVYLVVLIDIMQEVVQGQEIAHHLEQVVLVEEVQVDLQDQELQEQVYQEQLTLVVVAVVLVVKEQQAVMLVQAEAE